MLLDRVVGLDEVMRGSSFRQRYRGDAGEKRA